MARSTTCSKATPKLGWYDHDDPDELNDAAARDSRRCLFAAWATELFVCTESNPNYLDPVLALLRPSKAGPQRQGPES